MNGIVNSQVMYPSTKARTPKDARYGDGQYVSDFKPGEKTNAQLSQHFLGIPFQGDKFSHHVAINVEGLPVKKPQDPTREHVYVIPRAHLDVPRDDHGNLSLTHSDGSSRIVGYGKNPEVMSGEPPSKKPKTNTQDTVKPKSDSGEPPLKKSKTIPKDTVSDSDSGGESQHLDLKRLNKLPGMKKNPNQAGRIPTYVPGTTPYPSGTAQTPSGNGAN
jgi:hypothetical protein